MLDHSGKPLALPSTSAQNLTPSHHLLCSRLALSHHPPSPGPLQPHPTLLSPSPLGLQTPLIWQPGDVIHPLPTGLSFPSQGKCRTFRTASKMDALWSLQSTDVLSLHAGRSPPRPSQAGFSAALAHTATVCLGSLHWCPLGPEGPFLMYPQGVLPHFLLNSLQRSPHQRSPSYNITSKITLHTCGAPYPALFFSTTLMPTCHIISMSICELLVFSHWKGMPVRAGDVSVW